MLLPTVRIKRSTAGNGLTRVLLKASAAERLMKATSVVQVINQTPIVPIPEKSCIAGILGTVGLSEFIKNDR